MIITIAGRYGSGASEVARKIASALDYTIYDDEIITAAYETGGMYLNENELRFYDDGNADMTQEEFEEPGADDELKNDVLPLDLRLGIALQGALNRIADGDNCILMGKCANYYLRNRKNAVILFMIDSDSNRINRIMNRRNCQESEANACADRADRRREEFYSYFTGEKWDDINNYDMCVNTGLLGTEGTAQLIRELVNMKEKQL